MNGLNINITKGVVNGSIYDILSYEEYVENQDSASSGNIAIKTTTHEGKEIVLPYKGNYNGNTNIPGVYNAGPVDMFVFPDESNEERYRAKRTVEISNADSINEILKKKETLARLAEPWITSPDNITKFQISEDDNPEMICLKEALNAKNIDFDKYAPRFGANFPNDKRQLKQNSATLNIIKRFCENLDMEAILILQDKNPNVPNPMGKRVEVSLTGTNFYNNDEN